MEDETTTEGTETPTAAAGDVEESKQADTQGSERVSTESAPVKKDDDQEKPAGGEGELAGDTDDETADKSEIPEGGDVGETDEGGTEDVAEEHALGEYGEEYEEYYVEEEIIIEEQVEEAVEGEEKAHVEGEEVPGEGAEEHVEGEESEKKEGSEELGEEEQAYPEEPPPDPAAPYDFSDSKEALKAPFELRPDQLAEVEQIWEMYQNYTPAYSDLDGWVTEKELVYMLNCLLLMTYTAEQLQELIGYCCRPPHAKGHIFYEQFLKMVTIRQRDFPIEEEIRSALQVYDPEKTGIIDRDYLREVLSKHGHKMSAKHVDNLIKEVDMSNDGTIGIEDVVGTMCLDLNKEDLQMLRAAVNPPDTGGVEQQEGPEDNDDDDD